MANELEILNEFINTLVLKRTAEFNKLKEQFDKIKHDKTFYEIAIINGYVTALSDIQSFIVIIKARNDKNPEGVIDDGKKTARK
jgi:hypothetical protein